jgi:hypothetical protein
VAQRPDYDPHASLAELPPMEPFGVLLRLAPEAFTAAGVSRRKAATMRTVAQLFLDAGLSPWRGRGSLSRRRLATVSRPRRRLSDQLGRHAEERTRVTNPLVGHQRYTVCAGRDTARRLAEDGEGRPRRPPGRPAR